GLLELRRDHSRLGQDGCQACLGSPPRGHRLIDMLAASQYDIYIFTVMESTPALEATAAALAREPDGQVHLEFAAVLSHSSSQSSNESPVIQSTLEWAIKKAVEAGLPDRPSPIRDVTDDVRSGDALDGGFGRLALPASDPSAATIKLRWSVTT